MEHRHLAERLMSEERRKWMNPEKILEGAGLRSGMTAADLGCGPGFFTIPMARMLGAGRVYAVDSNQGMLDLLRENVAKSAVEGAVEILKADVCATEIPPASVDLVLVANVVHDVEEKGSLLAEIRRIGKEGALLVDVDWQKKETGQGPPLEIRLSEEESRRIFEEGGFRVSRRIEAGPYHYGLVCRRG